MPTLRRALAIAALTALAACGGGGSGTTSPSVAPATVAPAKVSGPRGTATLTLRFPAHVARAKSTASASAAKRKPGYINPNGGSLVVTAFGTPLNDPSNLGNAYFSLGLQDPTTGNSAVTVSLPTGSYNPGDLTVTEYDSGGGCCTPLAYGYNASYTDINGNYADGSFSVSLGSAATPVVTMVMNPVGIAFTSDPLMGSDAVALSTNSGAPTSFGGCISSGQIYYAFPMDANSTFVLPGVPSGYTGGDSSSSVPGVPGVTLTNSYDSNTFGQQVKIAPGVVGGAFTFIDPGNVYFDNAIGSFQTINPLSQLNPPFGYNYYVNGYVSVGAGSC